MQNIQDIVNKIAEQKFAKVPSERVGHYWGDKMIAWRNSEENRLRNQNQWRPQQKLTPQQAEEIRRLHWEDNLSIGQLSEKFGVAGIGIRKILNNKRFNNPNAKYIGIKFRLNNQGKPKGESVVGNQQIKVYDEKGNFIKEDTLDNVSKELGMTRMGFKHILKKTNRKNFHKKSKKYFFRVEETPIFV